MPQWLIALLNLLGMGAGDTAPAPTVHLVKVTDYLNFIDTCLSQFNFETTQIVYANYSLIQEDRIDLIYQHTDYIDLPYSSQTTDHINFME